MRSAGRPSRRRSGPGTCRPTRGDVVGGVGGPGREVGEERLIWSQGLLLADPGDRLVDQVLGEVVALLRGLGRLHRLVELVQRRIPLAGLAGDEAVEVLKAGPGRPTVKRPPPGWSPTPGPRGTCRTGRSQRQVGPVLLPMAPGSRLRWHRGEEGVQETSQPESCHRRTPATAKAGRQQRGGGAAFTL
jgi:hypothetical protein